MIFCKYKKCEESFNTNHNQFTSTLDVVTMATSERRREVLVKTRRPGGEDKITGRLKRGMMPCDFVDILDESQAQRPFSRTSSLSKHTFMSQFCASP